MVLLHLSALALAGVAYALNASIADYAPLVNQTCPDTTTAPLLRSFAPNNQSLHPREEAYVDSRLSTVVTSEWKEWIGDIGYDLNAFNNSFPKVGLAISGGGYRAALYGAGVLSALDARNQLAKTAGTGGLLQVASYMAALSGGSWFTGSLYMNDFPNIQDLVFGNGNDLEGWLLDVPLITPGGGDVLSKQNQDWYGSVLGSVIAKGKTGIDTSLTDSWSRALSYHFLNQTSRSNFFTNDTAHGAGQLWSEVPLLRSWQQHQVPFPIIQADSRPAGSKKGKVDPSSTVYEMTPMEFGSWDPNLSAMINMSHAGTHLTDGQPDNSTECTTHFDQTGFIMGTSSSLFNQLNLTSTQNAAQGFDESTGKSFSLLLSRQLGLLPSRAFDVANWPNPFHKLSGRGNFQDVNSEWLELIDGGSNDENLPLGQLFVKARDVDVVVAVDSTQETATTWPNGTSLLSSAARNANLLQSSHQPLPPLPSDAAEFVSTGVNMRPTFFGCFPTQSPPEYPLLIFLPNSPPLNGDDPVNNPSSFKTNYSQKHTRLLIDQVFANAVGGFVPNTTSADADFGKALQCAAIDRARYKVNPVLQRSAVCEEQFERYCWNPNNLTSVSELPGRKLDFVDPDSDIPAVSGFLSQSQQKQQKISFIIGYVFLGLAIAAVSGLLIWRIFSWRRAAYKKVTPFREDDYDYEDPPFLHHKRYSGSEKQSHLTSLSAFTPGIDDEFEPIRLW